MILQGELGSVPFLPKAKDHFPAKGLVCLHGLVKSGAQGQQVKKSVILFLPACSTSVGKLPLCSETSGFSLFIAGKITACHCSGCGTGGPAWAPGEADRAQRWSLLGREWHLVGPGEEGKGRGAREHLRSPAHLTKST